MEHVPLYGLARVRGWNIDPAVGLAIALVYSALMVFLFVRARLRYRALPELVAPAQFGATPDCMVVIPARNEAGVIGGAVRSLPADSVIVVDDGSRDKTGAEAEEAGAGVLRVSKLPHNVLGKAHACMVGAKIIDAKWILFADADTRYENGWLETMVAAAEASGLSFLSAHLKQEPVSLASALLLPYMQALFFVGINPKLNPDGAFRGECILARREAYEFIGGHGTSLTFPVEDFKLATLALRHRMKIGLIRTAMGRTQCREGWREWRHKAARTWQRFALLPVNCTAAALMAIFLGALWLPVILLTYAAGWPLAALGIAMLPMLLLLPWYRNAFRALLIPFAVYAMLPIAGYALYCVWTTKKILWKGREV